MARLRYNALKTGSAGSGVALALGASLTSSATSVTFNAALTHSNGTAVPTIVSPDYIPLEILDATGNMLEIVWLTAYTAAATTGTITRGQEGTTGVAHSSGDKISHGATAADLPAPATVCRRTTAQSNAGSLNTMVAISWDTEDADPTGLHDTSTNPSRFTIPTGMAGDYLVTANVELDANAGLGFSQIFLNGSGVGTYAYHFQTTWSGQHISNIVPCAVGDYIEVRFQSGATVSVKAGSRVAVKKL